MGRTRLPGLLVRVAVAAQFAVTTFSAPQVRKRPLLLTVDSEVAWSQPCLKCSSDARPLGIGDGIPRRVAASALVDDCLSEDALEREAVTERRGSGGRVQ